jgi:hypothetical protein
MLVSFSFYILSLLKTLIICQYFCSPLRLIQALWIDRKGLTTFENMPFLHVEDALLEARKACPLMLFVMQ